MYSQEATATLSPQREIMGKTMRETMPQRTEPLPSFLTEPSKIGQEISITGKWIPRQKGMLFWKSAESREMLQEWDDIHADAKSDPGVLSTEINHAVGEDAVLVHHVFKDPEALVHYFSTTATEHMGALTKVAKPALHLIRGGSIPESAREALLAKNVPAVFGEYLFGFVKEEYEHPDLDNAIMVTAKWTCNSDDPSQLEELKHWWQRVATDAHSMELGMLRFEAYQVIGENALIIYEVFKDTDELKFHLTKGTAAKYKNDIDKIAAPENYFFRGPVSWTIRTYSKFLHLPATYSSLGSIFTQPGGSMSDGVVPMLDKTDESTFSKGDNMNSQEITVFYKWTAKPGKLDKLKAIYQDVYKAMEDNEPDSLKMECYFADEENAIIIHDVFKDGAALSFHLGGTAAHHFPQLAEIAVPGPFFFCGNVPEELKQAAINMNMGAEFGTHAFGFERS